MPRAPFLAFYVDHGGPTLLYRRTATLPANGYRTPRPAIRRDDLPRVGGYFTSEMRVTSLLPFVTQMLAPSKATNFVPP